MAKYIVFDFDGTLADSKAIFVSLYNKLALQGGYRQMTPENLDYLRGLSISERCSYLKIPLYKVPFLAAKVIREYRLSLPYLEFNPGIEALLKVLENKGVYTAVVSTNSQANIKEFFRQKGITGIDNIYCSRSLFGKDRLLKKFLGENNLKVSDIIYVGDEARDIIACRKCGVKVAWVSWGYDTAQAITDCPPDYIINHPPELAELAEMLLRD